MGDFLDLEALGYGKSQKNLAMTEEELKREKRRRFRYFCKWVLRQLKARTPSDSGRLRAGMRLRFLNDDEAEIYATDHAEVLPFLTQGTESHVIPIGGELAQRAKGYPLRWMDEWGIYHTAWSVVHPGTEANPFIEEVAALAGPQVQAFCTELLNPFD